MARQWLLDSQANGLLILIAQAMRQYCRSYVDLMKFWYERDGVGPRWPWYFDPTPELP